MFFHSADGKIFDNADNCLKHTSVVFPASLSSNFSPIQNMTDKSFLIAVTVFSAII